MIKKLPKRIFTSLAVMLFAFAIAASVFLNTAIPVSASAAVPTAEAESSVNKYNFSAAGSFYTKEVAPSELLAILGFEPTDEESEYVDARSTLKFSYDTGITTANVWIALDNTGDVEVYVDEYVYGAENGVTVTWVPVSATLGNVSADFSPLDGDAGYSHFAVFYGAGISENDDTAAVEVVFESSFSFEPDAVNALINLAYSDAVAAKDRLTKEETEYEKLLAEYKKQSALFAEYLVAREAYSAQKALYDEYLAEKAEYDTAFEARAEYLAALAEYERLLEEYRIFKEVTEPKYNADYASYLKYKEAYDYYKAVELPVYEAAEAEAMRFREHLKIIETVKTPMTDGRTLYDAIMGSTVTQVLSRQEEIVAAGIPEELVTLAGECTDNLRELFTGYFSLTDEADKYFYYAGSYTEFRDNFYNLLRTLDYFYTFDNDKGLVRTELVKSDKAKKYVILLSQLYVVTSALHDGRIYSYSGEEFTDLYKWSYSTTPKQEAWGNAVVVTPLSMLENVVYLTDTNSAEPYDEQFPELVEKPEPPTEVARPEPLKTVYEPVEPVFVPDPGEPPTEVTEPEPPTEAGDPGPEPTAYTPTEDELWLSEKLELGRFAERARYSDDVSVKQSIQISKKIFPEEETEVYFFASKNDAELLFVTVVDSGTAANFKGPVPERTSDERYHYKFSHWVDKDGGRVDLSRVEGSYVYLYAAYITYDVEYVITWNIDGDTFDTVFKYGEMPSFDGVPERPKDDYNVYTFASWDKPLSPVSGNATYTAIFDATPYYTVEWRIGETSYFTEHLLGEMPVCPNDAPSCGADGTYTYTYITWDRTIEPATENTVYTAVSQKQYVLSFGNAGASATLDATAADTAEVDISPMLELLEGRSLTLITKEGELTFGQQTLERMLNDGITTVSLVFEERNGGVCYKLLFFDRTRSAVKAKESYTFGARLPLPLNYTQSMRFYRIEENKKILTPVTVSQGRLSAVNLEVGVEYFMTELYSVAVIESGSLGIIPSTELAAPGERVTVSLAIPDGMEINKLYYIDTDGTEHTITDMQFTMPREEVRVWGSAVSKIFKIRFVNYDGRYIMRTCKWGEIPSAPSFVRNSDSSYSYTFLGWDKEIVPVTADADYNAVYEKTPVQERDGGRTFGSGFEKFKFYVTLYAINVYRFRVAVVISLMVSLGAAAGFIAFKKYRKKHPIS